MFSKALLKEVFFSGCASKNILMPDFRLSRLNPSAINLCSPLQLEHLRRILICNLYLCTVNY